MIDFSDEHWVCNPGVASSSLTFGIYIFILPRLSTALHKVTVPKRNFHPTGLVDDWDNAARRLLIVEKVKVSTFLAADLATTVADMFVELYCWQDQLLF